MRYDCRKEGRDPTAVGFPCNVKILHAVTRARIANVFFLDTMPEGANPTLGRFVVGPDGEPMASSTRKKRQVEDHCESHVVIRGGKRIRTRERKFKTVVEYERLEQWERVPWVAVAVDTNEIIARSEVTT